MQPTLILRIMKNQLEENRVKSLRDPHNFDIRSRKKFHNFYFLIFFFSEVVENFMTFAILFKKKH